MRHLKAMLLLAALLFLLPMPARAWLWNNETLFTLDGKPYTSEDFKSWWRNWREEGTPLPATPTPYIDWLLLAREAERMDLASEPTFKRRIEVFLQARTLLLLKHEAVDSRIKITEPQIKSRYESRYTPRWQVQLIYFQDEAAAAAAHQALQSDAVTIEALLERSPEQGGPLREEKQWQRPAKTDPGWIAIFEGLQPGGITAPIQMSHTHVILRLLERKKGDSQDLEGLREQIHRELWKEREEELTVALLDRLRQKFKVRVNEERLAALPLDAPDDAYTEAVVITTSRQNVTERDFIAVARREMNFRQQYGSKKEEDVQLKQRLAQGILAQTLTNWESLDRRYEEKEPFKHDYRFYRGHRLILELERRLFAPGATVTEEEVKQHYQANLAQYTRPEMVNLFVIEDAHGLADKVWREVAVRGDFRAVVQDFYRQDIPPLQLPYDHLEPEVQAVVNRLSRGETSQPFTAGDRRLIIHLVERTPAAPVPLAEVSAEIHKQIQQGKIGKQREEYLATLKSRSTIAVQERNWQAVRKELGES